MTNEPQYQEVEYVPINDDQQERLRELIKLTALLVQDELLPAAPDK